MPYPKVKLSDDSGNAVGVTSNRLDVNVAGATMSTGDIEVNSEFPAAATIADDFANPDTTSVMSMLMGYDTTGTNWNRLHTNAGTMGTGTLRITIATDDTHFGAVGSAADSDGNIHGQLRYIGNATNTLSTTLNAVDGDTSNMANSLDVIDDWDATQNSSVPSDGVAIMGEAKVIDGSALPNTVSEGSASRFSMSRAGVAYTCLTDDGGLSDLGTTITTHLSEIEGAVETIEGAIGGTEMQVDIVSAPTLTVNSHAVTNAGTFAVQSTLQAGSATIGKLAANSGVDIGDVDVTSTVQPTGFSAVAQFTTNIGTSATQLDAQACKHADVMAKVGNAGIVYVGGSGVAATTGIALYPGDVYSVEVTNTNLLYGIAVNDNDDLQVVYYA